MFWPTVLCHKIDSDSPLWDVTARDISSKQFEIVLTFEGTTPETGNTVQVRDHLVPYPLHSLKNKNWGSPLKMKHILGLHFWTFRKT